MGGRLWRAKVSGVCGLLSGALASTSAGVTADVATEPEPAWSPVTELGATDWDFGADLAARGAFTAAAWMGQGGEWNSSIWARVASGDQLTPARRIGFGDLANVTVNPSGDAVAVWRRGLPDTDTREFLVAAGSADGTWVRQARFPTRAGRWVASEPSAAINDAGTAVVSWTEDTLEHTGPSRAMLKVAYRTPAGTWRAPVNVSGVHRGVYGRAVLGPTGRVLAVYGTETGLFTRTRVPGLGWRQPRRLHEWRSLPLGLNVDMGATIGTAVVTWPRGERVFALRRVGGSWGRVTRVVRNATETGRWDVALDGTGHATIVWERGDHAITVRRWPTDADVPGQAVVVGPPHPPLSVDDVFVASNAAGDVVLGWGRSYQNDSRVEVVYGPAGEGWGSPATLTTGEAPADTSLSDVTIQDDGLALVAWTARTPDDTSSILARTRTAP